jgi:hypothetical protein
MIRIAVCRSEATYRSPSCTVFSLMRDAAAGHKGLGFNHFAALGLGM